MTDNKQIALMDIRIPAGWTLITEMTFGKPLEAPGPKNEKMKKPLGERLFVYGADA